MTNLGPTPAPRLEPLRPGERDRGLNDRPPMPHKPLPKRTKNLEAENEADFVKDEDHQLDERA